MKRIIINGVDSGYTAPNLEAAVYGSDTEHLFETLVVLDANDAFEDRMYILTQSIYEVPNE